MREDSAYQQQDEPVDAALLPEQDDDFLVLGRVLVEPVDWALAVASDQLPDYSVFIRRSAAINIMRHCEKGLQQDREVAGGLVGYPVRDVRDGRIFTRIGSAPALKGHSSKYEVVILPEEWAPITTRIREEEDGGNNILVGWYHSHPTFEAYLSETDQLTQSQFFSEPWNIAIVVGPLLRQIKAFHGKYSSECTLFLDPEETGGALVRVTYEVSAGPVSTDAGIEAIVPLDDMPLATLPPDSTGFVPLGPVATTANAQLLTAMSDEADASLPANPSLAIVVVLIGVLIVLLLAIMLMITNGTIR